jgi:hypothetical protein
MPIGTALAEMAQITGDVDPALRWGGYPALIGGLDCTPLVRQQNNGQWVDH